MISFESKGSFKNTDRFLDRMSKQEILNVLSENGQLGVNALASATPRDSGMTSTSWYYTVEKTGRHYTISWCNSNVVNGVPVAILLQYGHGTGTGGYVQGRDYINPSIKPVFDKISENVWKAVTST